MSTGGADDALTFRTRQVAELRGLLAQRSAELDEARAELVALRATLAATRQDLDPEATPGRRRWRDRLS